MIVNLPTLNGILDFQSILPVPFGRGHSSYLVHRDAITAMEENRFFFGDNELPIGRTYKKNIDFI